jgi:hypothetical protein
MQCLLAAVMLWMGVAHAQDAPPAGEDAFAAFQRARAVVLGEGDAAPDAGVPVWGVTITVRTPGTRFIADAIGFDTARAGLIDAVAREASSGLGPDARLTVEFAGRPSPIDGTRGLGEAALSIRPGLDAVAVRAGDRVAVVFPDAALAAGMLPSQMLVSALREALGDRLPAGIEDGPGAWERYADTALRNGDAKAFRASVTALAQVGEAPAPVLLHRGGRVIGITELSPEAMNAWAGALASHLSGRRYDGLEPYGLRGTYDPLRDEFLAPVESPFAQALAAHALLRFGRSGWAPAANTQRARTAGFVILRQLAFITPIRVDAMADLGQRAPLEQEPWGDVASAAMTIIAMEPLEAEAFDLYPELQSMRERCAEVVRSAVGRSITGAAVFADDVPPAAQALVARALVALGRSDVAQPEDLETGQAAARAVVERTEPAMLVSQMPWALAAMGPDERQDARPALTSMRTLIVEHQLSGPIAEGDDRDLAGGIVFTRGGPPVPTWQSARAAAALGVMLNDPSLTPREEQPAAFMDLLRTLRFLRQLTIDESLEHLMADPARAAGGVRAALWDQRQPSIATSLTLLAVCDALDAAYQEP